MHHIKEALIDISHVLAPSGVSFGVVNAINVDHYSAAVMHGVAIVCTILITQHKLRKK